MTFKDLQKLVGSQQSGPELSTVPKDIPFWIFNPEQHRQEDIRYLRDNAASGTS